MIYIDPPYGANSMGQSAGTNYKNSYDRDDLLSMLYPRLNLAKQLLSDEGVIFCSIDDKNQAYVKGLFDEVFGEDNFISNIIWQSTGGSNTGKNIITVTEYILMYSKSKNYKIKLLEKQSSKYILEDKYVEERGKYYLQKLDGKFTKKHYSESLFYPISYNGVDIYPGGDKNTKDLWNWRWSANKVKWGIKKGFIEFKTELNEVKVYFKNYEKVDNNNHIRKPSVPPKNVFIGTDVCTTATGTKQLNEIVLNNNFEFPKNTILIKFLINLIEINSNAIILDFFAGSGTTGQAVMELNREDGGNRKFILCTNNEKTNLNPNGIAYDVTSKRLKRIMTGKCYDETNNFKWLEKNKPYGDNLDVFEIYDIENFKTEELLKNIDETNYELNKFDNYLDKIKWIAENFENTQLELEDEDEKRNN